MWKEGCQIELSLYDIAGWWAFLTVLKSVSVAIKYDTGYYVIFKNETLHKVKEKKIKTKITHTETKVVDCKAWYVGKIWLDNCIDQHRKFESAKEFAQEYCKMVGSLSNA